MSLISGKEMRFKCRLKHSDSTSRSCNKSGSELQLSGLWLRKPECQKYCDKTAEYSVCDGWPNGDVAGWKLWRLARINQQGALELGTCTEHNDNSHGMLVLHPLGNSQPVQVITQQPWKPHLCFLVPVIRCTAAFWTHCNILNPLQHSEPTAAFWTHCNLSIDLLSCRHQDLLVIID